MPEPGEEIKPSSAETPSEQLADADTGDFVDLPSAPLGSEEGPQHITSEGGKEIPVRYDNEYPAHIDVEGKSLLTGEDISPGSDLVGKKYGHNPERAHAEAITVNEHVDERGGRVTQGVVEKLTDTVGKSAGMRHEIESFDKKNPELGLKEGLRAESAAGQGVMEELGLQDDNRDAVIKFNKHLIENQEKHGEALSPNQEMIKAILAFVERYGRGVHSKDGHTYHVGSHRDRLVLKRYPSDSDLIVGVRESWQVEPWKIGEVTDSILPTRPGISGGVYYEVTDTQDSDEDGYDEVRVITKKQKFGVTREEVDAFVNMLENLEVEDDPKRPPNFHRL